MKVELLCRSHFVSVPDATAENIAANVWRVRIPLTPEVLKRSRRASTAEAWDGAIVSIDGVESEPVTGSGEGKGYVEVTALLFG